MGIASSVSSPRKEEDYLVNNARSNVRFDPVHLVFILGMFLKPDHFYLTAAGFINLWVKLDKSWDGIFIGCLI